MKKFFSLAAFLVIAAMAMSSQAEAKYWLVSSFSAGATGPGLRGETGNLVWDVYPTLTYRSTAPAATNKTIPIYFDIYSGSWGLGVYSADIGAGVDNFQLQYAAEQMFNDKIGVGVSVNVIDYRNLLKTIGVATGLNSYIIVAL